MSRVRTLLLAALPLFCGTSASAHLTYTAPRDFGFITLANTNPVFLPTPVQATKSYGWADGTDADWAKQDDQRYLNFRLANPLTITITVTSGDVANFLPAFSIYQGVGNQAAATYAGTAVPSADYDGSTKSQDYYNPRIDPNDPNSARPNPALHEGVFTALSNFQIANDEGNVRSFTYMGNAADGTAANYGSAAGINGDGVADGTVSRTFSLPAGDYTLVVGGATYSPQGSATTYNFTPTIQAVPEPSTALLIAGGVAVGSLRRRQSGTSATL